MGKINPAREFLRRVKNLCDTVNALTETKWDEKKREYHHKGEDGRVYWPFGYNHECFPKDCFKRDDGIWEQNKMINTHMKDGGSVVVFIWRLHPNYSCQGQPSSQNDNQLEFHEKSENEKVLLETEELEFVWRWVKVIPPNRNIWGSRMGPTFFEVRDKKTKAVLIQSESKAALIRDYKEFLER